MDQLTEFVVAHLPGWLPVADLASDLGAALKYYGLFFVVLYLVEWRAGQDLSRYRSAHFLTDLAYRVYFSVYIVLLYLPVTEAVSGRWPTLLLGALNEAPLWIGVPAYLLAFDFLSYWIHRAQHTRWWWRFHRVHHSQEQMTFATGYRNHPIDQIFAHTVTFLPLMLLGAPALAWLPYSLLMSFIDATHHANLEWRWTPVRKLLVSPVFHAAHHSTDPRYYDTNFGGVFSVWDFLFGTASDVSERPESTGVVGWQVKESFFAHLLSPFRRDSVVTGVDSEDSPPD